MPPCDHDFSVLDTFKVSDTILFLISAAMGLEDNQELIDQWGETILMTSFAQVLSFFAFKISILKIIDICRVYQHQ